MQICDRESDWGKVLEHIDKKISAEIEAAEPQPTTDDVLPVRNSGRTGHHDNHVKGESHGSSILKEWQVIQARRLAKTGKYTIGRIARIIGVNYKTIQAAISGATWGYLNEMEPPVHFHRTKKAA